MRHPAYFLAFGMGIGLLPKAPGTISSLCVLPFVWLWYYLNGSIAGLTILCGLLFIVGAWCCQVTGRAIGVPDYAGFVIDEMVAMIILLIALPYSWKWWGVAFILFRWIDIQKPWPINWVDRTYKNGLGVMLDDLLAAGYVLIIYHGIQMVFLFK